MFSLKGLQALLSASGCCYGKLQTGGTCYVLDDVTTCYVLHGVQLVPVTKLAQNVKGVLRMRASNICE